MTEIYWEITYIMGAGQGAKSKYHNEAYQEAAKAATRYAELVRNQHVMALKLYAVEKELLMERA